MSRSLLQRIARIETVRFLNRSDRISQMSDEELEQELLQKATLLGPTILAELGLRVTDDGVVRAVLPQPL